MGLWRIHSYFWVLFTNASSPLSESLERTGYARFAANVGDFSSSKGYGAGANRPEIQKFVQKYILHFRSNKMHFCNYLGRGFIIPEYKGN